MQEDLIGRRTRKRARPTPLRCYIVDDHCDALSKIHGAIRRGSLPFTGLSALHFDAHPDLMVTPDMPAETCFSPHALYDALAEAEGGIAEWILPLVYQVSTRHPSIEEPSAPLLDPSKWSLREHYCCCTQVVVPARS